MIPLRLSLRNFMCYTDVHEPLDFSGIHVACLSGDNGHGKSTLLDAMTWVLWGRARARTTDELIHSGRTEMEVELEFLLDNQRYRVIRKRDSRGRGQSVLELAVYTGDGWRPLTGNNQAETERQIQDLLRMSYETFTHSSFILQGQADTFTTATPSQRKQVLAEILGLSYYDELEGLAREQARNRQEQAGNLRLRIDETERELARKPALEEERDRCQARMTEVELAIELAEQRLAAAQSQLAQLVSAESQLADVQRNLGALRDERNQTQRRCEQLRERLAKVDRILAREAEVTAGYQRLLATRAELETFNAKLVEHSRLTGEAAAIEREIAAEQGAAESARRGLEERLRVLEVDAARVAAIERELADARAAVERATGMEKRRAELERERNTLSERTGALRGVNERLRAEMVSLRERLDQLQGAEACPLCRADLSPERHRHVTTDYEAQGLELKAQYQRNQREAKHAEGEGEKLAAEQERLDAELRELTAAQQRQMAAELALKHARGAEAELAAGRARLAELTRGAEGPRPSESLQARLRPLIEQIAVNGYRTDRHEELRRQAEELRQFEPAQATLEQARRVHEEDRPHLEDTERSLVRITEMVQTLEQQAALLAEQAQGVAAARTTAEAAEAEARLRRRERDKLADELAAVRQQLQFCDRQAEIRAELERDRLAVVTEQGLYSDLALALGKNGVQAMLIDTAIPEIDEHANELLARMTDGRMHLKLEMQRPKRGGGLSETLDIKIGDELGTRSYELYSGGEAFRVNFALRIALSRLLARRAGAKLQTLVIDEGFGSQDVDGRDRIVDAIKAIQDDFEKILVITHIPELKDVFPVRIEITKTPLGSVIALT